MYGYNKPEPTMTFQFIGPNKLIFKDKNDKSINDEIDYETYKLFVNEKFKSNRDDIELVPKEYFDFLQKTKSFDDIPFNENKWNQNVAPRLSTKMNECMYSFQKEAVYKMIEKRRCLNASSMGIGKSLQGLAALSYFKSSHKGDIIICPGYLRKNWENEARLWLPEKYHDGIVVITKAGKKELPSVIRTLFTHKGTIIVSYDMLANIFNKLKPELRKGNVWNTVLMDESHFVKDSKTKRFKMLQGSIKGSNQVFLLTGTPSPNRPKELFAQFSLLEKNVFKNYRTFAFRYCGAFFDYFKNLNDRGSSNIQELAFLMSKLVIRLRREDVLEDLPEKTRYMKLITPTSTSSTFKKLMKEFLAQLELTDQERSASFKVQSLASEMFRETARMKEKPIIEYLTNFIQENDRKTVLFCKHQVIFKSIQEFLTENSIDHIGIDGGTKMTSRPQLIDRFLTDPNCNYALLTIGSCQTGLNIKGIDRMIFCELSWSPAELAQCEARITRIGSTKSKLEYIYLICDNSLDQMVFNKLSKKNDLTSNIVDQGRNYGDFDFVEDDRDAKRRKLS
jgi:SNF2 family DNA or RNA helicase